MTHSLSEIYESARLNVPSSVVPNRAAVPAWDALDGSVRYELEVLQGNILSVHRADARLLLIHQRVITQFNQGLRAGFLETAAQAAPGDRDQVVVSQDPFQWGVRLGRRARAAQGALAAGAAPRTFGQFVTATHLLAYECGQLEAARTDPLGFVLREVGPQHAKEFGELVFALPVLLNYRTELVARILDAREFDFAGFHGRMPCAPTHLEYLEHGLAALFDPRPDAWIEVAASLGLAAEAFVDGGTINDEDHNAPLQAILSITRRPITAWTLIRHQVERIELARRWTGGQRVTLETDHESPVDATLWDAFGLLPCAAIRGGDQQPHDLIAYELIRALSAHLARNVQPSVSRFVFLRRHVPAFARGFDERFEAALDARALGTARVGAQVGAGLRRFVNGEAAVDAVLDVLVELDKLVRDLEHAAVRPVEFVRKQLSKNVESPVSDALITVIDEHPNLARELFQEHPEYDFFSSTSIQTGSPFDLLRSALFHALQSQSPNVTIADEREEHRTEARRQLASLIERHGGQRAEERTAQPRYRVVLTRDSGVDRLDEQMAVVARARLLLGEFDALTRVIRGVLMPLHVAFRLNREITGDGVDIRSSAAPVSDVH